MRTVTNVTVRRDVLRTTGMLTQGNDPIDEFRVAAMVRSAGWVTGGEHGRGGRPRYLSATCRVIRCSDTDWVVPRCCANSEMRNSSIIQRASTRLARCVFAAGIVPPAAS